MIANNTPTTTTISEQEKQQPIATIPSEEIVEDDAQDESTGLKKQRFVPDEEETKHACHTIFKCKNTRFDVRSFSILDKLNKNQPLFGFICKRDGELGGSMYIVNVNGQPLKDDTEDKRELVYATPKLRYAYNKDFNDYVEIFQDEENIDSYYISEKWNGTNILLFKYHDKDGNVYISGKTKGLPFLSDTSFGNFLSSTLEGLHLEQFVGKYEELCLRDELMKIHNDVNNQHYSPHIQEFLNNSEIQCISFEVCGNSLPHLVKYEFGIELKPLFYGFSNGKIKPCLKVKGMEEFGPIKYYPFHSHASCVKLCKMLQANSLQKNESYRKEHNLKHKYEYEHFAIEGHVLYLLDSNGFLVNRNMYKVKSGDVEEVHWQKFDAVKKGQVKDTVLKMKQRGLSLSDEKALRKELDIGDKEWGKFGSDILRYISTEFNSDGTKKPGKPRNKKPKETATTQPNASSTTASSSATTVTTPSTTVITPSVNATTTTDKPKRKHNHRNKQNKSQQVYVKKESAEQ